MVALEREAFTATNPTIELRVNDPFWETTMKQLNCLMAAGLVLVAFAGAAAAATDDAAAVDREFNQVSGQLVEVQMGLLDQEQDLARCWDDPRYDTAESQELRKRLEALKQEMLQVQADLRARISEHPEVKPRVEKIASEKALAAKLARQREALQLRREALRKAAPKPR